MRQTHERDLHEIAKTCDLIRHRCREIFDDEDPSRELRADIRKAAKHLKLAVQYLGKGAEEGSSPASQVAGNQVDNLESRKAAPASVHKGLVGDTKTIALGDLIGWLSVQDKTGVLKVTTPSEVISLEFLDGELVGAFSSNAPEGSRLGEILVEDKAITSLQLKVFLKKYAKAEEKVGAALEREELVTKEQLRAALENQAQQLFNRLFAEKKASFCFYENVEAKADGRLQLNAASLILESARLHDEAGTSEH